MPDGADFRLLTPRGAGGVAVVEVRGPRRLEVLADLVECGAAGDHAARRAALATGAPVRAVLRLAGSAVDDVLVVDRPRIGSTELHLHGSPAVVGALAQAVGLASGGEPCAAGRLLREAHGDGQLALALEQAAHRPFAAVLAELATLPPDRRAREVAALRARSVVACAVANAEPVVLFGRQNAGKSTLLNRLAFAERALTGDLPGLTRDAVEAEVMLEGYPYRIVDTAGEGPVTAGPDVAALERARTARTGACCVLVCDGSRAFHDVEMELVRHAVLVVRTKADLEQHAGWPVLPVPVVPVTCLDAAAAPAVRSAVGGALRALRGLPPAPAHGIGGPAALDARELAAVDRL